MADHSVAKYVSAMAHGREGLAGLGGQGLVGLVDPNVAKQHKELAGFRGWVCDDLLGWCICHGGCHPHHHTHTVAGSTASHEIQPSC